jgi:[acyl-carrier-protein] S-malonyltransferase
MPVPSFVAGHSLGEYAALAAAGALDFKTAIYLVRQRGRLMYEAGQQNAGSMAAVLGLDEGVLTGICRETGTVIANYNCPGQLVISGAKDNVNKAADMAKTRGAARVVPLQVSGAFHSPLMQPAVDGLAKIVSKVTFKTPEIPVIANVTAQPLTAAEQIKAELINQLNNGVQWQRSVEYMINNGVTDFIEIGPGKVLAGIIKRINKNVNVLSAGDVASVRNIAVYLKDKTW